MVFRHNLLIKIVMPGLVVLVSLSCSLFTATPQPVEMPSPQVNPPVATDSPVAIEPPVIEPPANEIPAPTRSYPSGENSDILVEVDYLYTSNLITIIYPLYGSILDDFAIITVTNSSDSPAQVVVMSEIMDYTTPEIDTITLEAGEWIEIRQNPLLKPEVLDQLNVEKPAQFHIRVTELVNGDEKLLLDETGETIVYARRDFPWSIPGFTDQEVFELVAAMVMPNDPAVEELIRLAADYTSSGMMWSGYGGHVDDDDGGVWERLEAIWDAENDYYDLTYISTWVSFAPGSVQRIRLPSEVLEQRSGNCIELAILFASAAEAMDLETAIIGVPGHAYVAVRTDQVNANYYFVETTMIGQATFEEAVDYGGQEFEDALPYLDDQAEGYGWVTIWDAREKGILPLPWH
jgi:hypothetical protein